MKPMRLGELSYVEEARIASLWSQLVIFS